MAIFNSRQVAAEQSGALLDIALRHPFLQPVGSDGLANVDRGEHGRLRHSNQNGTLWQVEISAMTKLVQSSHATHCGGSMLRRRPINNFDSEVGAAPSRLMQKADSSLRSE
jgi:hypothetical protein